MMISVVIPTWNRRKQLIKAIGSILSQTYTTFEILVCDDGSTDGTVESINEMIKKDNRIKLIKGNPSGGPAKPRNLGIKTAQGEWIAFLDSDDIWLQDKLIRQLKYALKYNYDLVCCNAYRIKGIASEKYFSMKSGEINFSKLLSDNKVICSSVIVKKSVIVNVGNFPESKKFIAIEDYLTWLKIASIYKIGYLNETLLKYYDDPKNTIRSRWASESSQRKATIEYISQWLFNNPRFSIKYIIDLLTIYNQRFKY